MASLWESPVAMQFCCSLHVPLTLFGAVSLKSCITFSKAAAWWQDISNRAGFVHLSAFQSQKDSTGAFWTAVPCDNSGDYHRSVIHSEEQLAGAAKCGLTPSTQPPYKCFLSEFVTMIHLRDFQHSIYSMVVFSSTCLEVSHLEVTLSDGLRISPFTQQVNKAFFLDIGPGRHRLWSLPALQCCELNRLSTAHWTMLLLP